MVTLCWRGQLLLKELFLSHEDIHGRAVYPVVKQEKGCITLVGPFLTPQGRNLKTQTAGASLKRGFGHRRFGFILHHSSDKRVPRCAMITTLCFCKRASCLYVWNMLHITSSEIAESQANAEWSTGKLYVLIISFANNPKHIWTSFLEDSQNDLVGGKENIMGVRYRKDQMLRIIQNARIYSWYFNGMKNWIRTSSQSRPLIHHLDENLPKNIKVKSKK